MNYEDKFFGILVQKQVKHNKLLAWSQLQDLKILYLTDNKQKQKRGWIVLP